MLNFISDLSLCYTYSGKPVNTEIVLRKKKKTSLDRPVSHTEEAVITHKRKSPGLITPFEEVAISFQTKSSIVKKSFPVTHQQLLTEEDLSSPEPSDEESEEEEDQGIGFESMDMGKFEQFGNPLATSLPKGARQTEQVLQPKPSVKTTSDANARHPRQSREVDVNDGNETSSEASDDTVVVHEETEESLLPSAVVLKESQQQLQPPPSQIKQVPTIVIVEEERVDSVAELREIADSAGVQKRLSLFQRKDHNFPARPPQVASNQPIDLGVLRRGGVSARLKMFEDLEDGIAPQQPLPACSPRALCKTTQLPTMIVEEEEEEEEDEEMVDSIAPLPHIRAKEKKEYQEKHKMDGLSPEITRRSQSCTKSPTTKQPSKPSPLTSRVAAIDQPTQAIPRKAEKKAVLSPLMVSNKKPSSVSTTDSSSPIKNHPQEAEKKKENTARAIRKSSFPLLQKPTLSGDSVPWVFRNLDLSPGALRVWQLKVRIAHSYIAVYVWFW